MSSHFISSEESEILFLVQELHVPDLANGNWTKHLLSHSVLLIRTNARMGRPISQSVAVIMPSSFVLVLSFHSARGLFFLGIS